MLCGLACHTIGKLHVVDWLGMGYAKIVEGPQSSVHLEESDFVEKRAGIGFLDYDSD